MRFVTIGLYQDLERVVRDYAIPGSILVFPTRIAATKASAIFCRTWDLEERLFLSVEDLREYLILPESPVLTDEKRLLCLYLVMGEEQREFFHILNYSDIVDWGKRFFDFFEELAEECVDAESLAELNESGTFHLQQWQEIYLDRILEIRSAYRSYITALGYTDKIFYLAEAGIRIPWTGKQICYVNQYYYSALERAQLKALEEAGNEVILLTHGVQFADLQSLKMQDFDLLGSWNKLPVKPRLEIVETADETQMVLAFLEWKQANTSAKGIIIDSGYQQRSYSRYFQGKGISLPTNYPFCESGVFQMLEFIYRSLHSVLASGGYLPVKLLANFLSCSFFIRYFLHSNTRAETDVLAHEALNEMTGFLQADYLYVDEALFESRPDSPLKRIVIGFYGLLNSFSKVSSIAELTELLDGNDGLDLHRLMTEFELNCTNLEEIFWERMANFLAIEQLNLVKTWQQIFPVTELGQSLLELLLSYLKTARISYNPENRESPNWEVGNLLDSRNRSFETVAVLQMVEGTLPSAPTPVWLFNEAQRAKLGLKTYTDIRNWERYYFYRLLLTSRHAICYSYSNPERDIGASSFIGELIQLLEPEMAEPEFLSRPGICLQQLYDFNFRSPILTNEERNIGYYGKKQAGDFFIIPSEPQRDFKKKTICIGASGLIQLLKNPFLWFVEYHSKLQKLDWEADETIGGKLFGNIMHAYFASTFGDLKGHHSSLERLHKVFGDEPRLESELQKLITSPKMRYQIPKNYNAEFLGVIISRKLAESLNSFYTGWLANRLAGRSFVLIPEEESMTVDELTYKPLGMVKLQNEEYRLAVRGKADLRLELENEALIIDFKTGGHDKRQLSIYEWFYYLQDEAMPLSGLSSLFWSILDNKPTEGYKPDKREKVKAEILDGFLECLQSGYGLGKRVADRTRARQITRADLFVAGLEEAEND